MYGILINFRKINIMTIVKIYKPYKLIKLFNPYFPKINTISNMKGETLSTTYFVFDVYVGP
jgi:hypothetical protein